MQLSALKCSDTGSSERRLYVALLNGKLILVAASRGKEGM
jgi:hypothetical protein